MAIAIVIGFLVFAAIAVPAIWVSLFQDVNRRIAIARLDIAINDVQQREAKRVALYNASLSDSHWN